MKHHLTRALVVLAVPALVVSTVASSASAAPKPPAVPKLADVVKVYPKLKGGDFAVTTEKSVKMPGKGCADGAKIKGAIGRDATYGPKADPDAPGYGMGADSPMIEVTTETFPSAAVAKKYFTASVRQFGACMASDSGDPDVTIDVMKKVKVKAGQQSIGYQIGATMGDLTMDEAFVAVRTGKLVTYVVGTSMDGATPSFPKTVSVAKLALKVAR